MENPILNTTDSFDKPETQLVRFDNWQAFCILFSISFGPTFIALNLTVGSSVDPWAFVIVVSIIAIVFVLNYMSVDMLSKIQSRTNMTSYQEIAYTVSKSNRGYVYLVSLLKATYLVVTCAYSLQFCAVYPLSLIQINWQEDEAYKVWLVMFCFLFIFSAVALYFYDRNT
jgi:hypothetical protein